MKIIGIDPGYDRLGIAVIEKLPKQKECILYSDCFTTSQKDPIYDRFLALGKEVGRILDLYKPDRLTIETLFITKNQKTAMRVSEARGIIIYEATLRGIPISEYGPMEIKMAITGDGKSDKTSIFKMLKMLIQLPNKKSLDDEYDAIAVALTGFAISPTNK